MNKLALSFRYALKGIATAFIKERNMKIHAVAVVLVVWAGFYFHIESTQWLILLLTIAFVIGLEMINTAIEALVDLVTEEYRRLAAIAKDVAAGAVLISSIIAVIIGLIIFVPYLTTLF